MGGAGAVRLSLLHPELFCAAGSWGGGMRRGGEEILAAAEKNVQTLKTNNYAALLINGDSDRPDAFKDLADKFKKLNIPCEIQILPNTKHNLGLYYQLSGDKMGKFLGAQLQKGSLTH